MSTALTMSHLTPLQMGRKPTVARIYKNQLQELMKIINSTNPHWIRCVKPHHCKKPRRFHGQEVMTQMRSAGVLETVRIRKMGYSVRLPFADFVARYRAIAPTRGGPDEQCRAILAKLTLSKELGQVGKTKVFLKTEAWSVVEDARSRALNGFCITLQRSLLYRQATGATARQVALRRVRVVQAFARMRASRGHMRRVEYALREESLLAGVRELQGTVRQEERDRVALMHLEVDRFARLLQSLHEHEQEVANRWYRDRPMRDALEQSDFKVQEETYRMSLERLEQEQLLKVLDALKEDFDVMQQRELQRERLEEAQRLRIEEEELAEQRQRARLLWAKAREERRQVEEAEMAVEWRKWRELKRVSDNMDHAKALYETETQCAARVRRNFEGNQFCASVGAASRHARARSPNGRSKSPVAGGRAGIGGHGAPPAYHSSVGGPIETSTFANPTFSRISMAGMSQASQLHTGVSSSTPYSRARPSRARSPQPPKPVKADPNATHSLDMVTKLKRMSKVWEAPPASSSAPQTSSMPTHTHTHTHYTHTQQVQSNPHKLITRRCSPFNATSPNNPGNPEWHPDPDGTFVMPDGSKYVNPPFFPHSPPLRKPPTPNNPLPSNTGFTLTICLTDNRLLIFRYTTDLPLSLPKKNKKIQNTFVSCCLFFVETCRAHPFEPVENRYPPHPPPYASSHRPPLPLPQIGSPTPVCTQQKKKAFL